MGLLDIFKKKNQPKTLLEQAQAAAAPLIVSGYRKVAALRSIAPTSKTSDKKIIEIYQKVGTAFNIASNKRNEHIPAGQINYIVLNFFQVYELLGEEMFDEHLKYEVETYLKSGLRDDHKEEIKLF